jgi:hypothetical protein
MLRGMSRLLADGVPRINTDLSVSVLNDAGAEIHRLPPTALTRGGIGYVYERLVCIHYITNGYTVSHRASLGFLDQGIDLIAERPGERIFVQCKFTLKSMGPKRVEQLLYAASKFIKSNLSTESNYFDLVIPSKEIAFPPHKIRNMRASSPLKAFQQYNKTQNLIKLRINEVPIETPETIFAQGSGV